MSTADQSKPTHSPPSSPSSSALKKPRTDDLPASSAIDKTPSDNKDGAPTEKQQKKTGKGKKGKRGLPKRVMPDEAIMMDVETFLGKGEVGEIVKNGLEWESPLERDQVVELRVSKVGSSGDSISLYTSPDSRKWAILAPFALPNELIRVRIDSNTRLHSKAVVLEILEKNYELRLKEDPKCKYFGKCSGCQYQNVSYDTQLEWKRDTVRNAFANFSCLDPSLVPSVLPTIPSPKQFNYRTKITPHFKALPNPVRNPILESLGLSTKRKGHDSTKPPKAPTSYPAAPSELPSDPLEAVAGKQEGEEVQETSEEMEAANEVVGEVLASSASVRGKGNGGSGEGGRFFQGKTGQGEYEFKIGFDDKVSHKVMDIEECPLATPIINEKYTLERQRITETIHLFPRDATLLLRDSHLPDDTHTVVTDHKETVHERVGPYNFTFPAGSFFQNNASILVPLTSYVREAIFSPPTPTAAAPASSSLPTPTHLIDTYCGSGLFAITLSEHFEKVTGIEIDPKSITYAKENAKANGVEAKCEFKAGKSEEIFKEVQGKGFEWEKTVVVIDPPRKGCDEPFLEQLVALHPQAVVYVSCNVHTQARDVGYVLSKKLELPGKKYILESLRGFDLFPQTAHVEGVAVLRLVDC